MKKSFKLVFVILSIITISLVCGGYHIYRNRIIFPDKESEQIIKNIIKDHEIKNDDREKYYAIREFNDAINAFGGVENITIENNKVKMQPEEYSDSSYAHTYDLQDKLNFNNNEDYYTYICENYKYYNEEKLELLLTLYNCVSNKVISVNDIKSYVDEGNTESQKEIWEYVDWYNDYGEELFINYKAEFTLILDRENGDGEFTKKYGNKIFYNLTIDEQKEVVEYIYNQRIS